MSEQQNKPNENKPSTQSDLFSKIRQMDITDTLLKMAYKKKTEEEERKKAEIAKQEQLKQEEETRVLNQYYDKSNAIDVNDAEMANNTSEAEDDDLFDDGLGGASISSDYSANEAVTADEISEEELAKIKAETHAENDVHLTLNAAEKTNDAALLERVKQSTHKPVITPTDFDFTREENTSNPNADAETNAKDQEAKTESSTDTTNEKNITNAKPQVDTGFEFLNTPEYRKTHQTKNDDGVGIELEDERQRKAEMLRLKQAAEEKEKIKKEYKPQTFFRNDDLFSGKSNFIAKFNKGTKFIPFNFENLGNLLLSGLLIYGLVRWLNHYFELENIISVLYFLMITLIVGHFVPKLFNFTPQDEREAKKSASLQLFEYLRSGITSPQSKDVAILLFMLVGFGVAYFLPLNYFDFITKWTVIPLFIALVCMVLYITRWHLVASLVGVIIISLTMINKVTIIDWDNEHLELETVRIGVKHIRSNRVFSNVELVPSAVEIDTTGKYYVSTVNDGFTGSNNTIRDIPIYYTFKVAVKPTKSLLISMKLAKCYEDGGDNCDKFVEFYEQAKKENPQGLTVMPLFYTPQLAEKPIYITSFKDYKMLAKLHLERIIFDLMQQNLTQIKLPLKEADYRFIIPRKLEVILQGNNILLPIGNPEVKLALHQIAQLTLDVNQLKKIVK